MSNSNQELINSFKNLYCELKKSQFIMSNKLIVKILKFVASNEELKFSVDHANQIYNFADIYAQSTKNGRFVMPQDEYQVVVLVTGLLFNIDRGEINYLSFLQERFSGGTIAENFEEFCISVILPYITAFEKILSQDKKIVDVESQIQQSNLPKQLVELLEDYIISIGDQIMNDKTLQEQKKQDIYSILEGLNYSVEIGNTLLVKSMWLGLKYALTVSKTYTSQLKAFENELKNYGIIE